MAAVIRKGWRALNRLCSPESFMWQMYMMLVSEDLQRAVFPYEASEYLMGGCGIMFDRHVVATLLKYVPSLS